MSILREFSMLTGLSAPDLVRIIESAPKRYKTYFIPKKSGGNRLIAHPSRELKLLQRILLHNYLNKYPIHESAAAYVRGKNIYENASSHSLKNVTTKLDFSSFFPSIKAADWRRFIQRNDPATYSAIDLSLMINILFWGDGTNKPTCLSIGAPTSPAVSNIILYDLDAAIAAIADTHGFVYTRYADDITLSTNTVAQAEAAEKLVRRAVSALKYPKLQFNEDKSGTYSRGQRRMVTGLVITPDGDVSIGRERKRLISAMIHKYSIGKLPPDHTGTLKGFLGFALANEPAFVERARQKYGSKVINNILQTHIPQKTHK